MSHPSRTVVAALALSLAAGLSACSAPKPEPEIASSAVEPGYAASYPEELNALANDFGQGQVAAKKTIDEMPRYPGELKAPVAAPVDEIYTAADQAGRSYAYVERVREVDGARTFFDAESEEITKKVGGAAQYAAKQKSCDVDVHGPVAHALKENYDKQLEKRLRERNEGHHIIDRHRVALGKENAAALEKQVDAISYASYLVHIELVEQKVRMTRILAELETVKKTTADAIAAETEFQAAAGRKDEEKKASAERVAALQKSQGLLDSSVTQAQSMSDTMQERIDALQKEYADAKAARDEKAKSLKSAS